MVAQRQNTNKMSFQILIIFLVSFVNLCLGDSTSVPILLWTNGVKATTSEPVTAGKTLKASDVFGNILQPAFSKSDVVLVFLQEQLSIEDFTKHQGSFEYLKRASEKNEVLFVPSVTTGEDNFQHILRETVPNIIQDVFSSDLPTWKSGQSDKKFTIFHLPNGNGFEESVSFMKKVIESVHQSKKSFTAVYTGEQPSQSVSKLLGEESQVEEPKLFSRHLLANKVRNDASPMPDGRFFFNNSGCVYMVANSIRFGYAGKHIEFINANWIVSGTCGKEVLYSINLKTEDSIEGITDFGILIMMNHENKTMGWSCEDIQVSGKPNNTPPFNVVYPCKDLAYASLNYTPIAAPSDRSFTCNSLVFRNQTYVLTLGGVQIQPGVKDENFSAPSSCTGFFSLEILTGIFVVFTLLVGLFVGIAMMMSISTPDRFDDPKGKCISVPLTE